MKIKRKRERKRETEIKKSKTETLEQNENEIFTLKRSTYRDQLLYYEWKMHKFRYILLCNFLHLQRYTPTSAAFFLFSFLINFVFSIAARKI